MRAAFLACLVGLTLFGVLSLGAPPEPRFKLVLRTPPATAVGSVAVSPDGTLVATAAGEGGVRLYDARTGALLRVIGEAGDRGVVFSPDGRTLAAAGFHMDKLAGLWDVTSGARVRTFAGHTQWETDATAISADGTLLASSGTDGQILVWDVASGRVRHQLKDQPHRISALAFSPDGGVLAAGGDATIRLFDCATGEVRRTLAGQGGWVCTLAFTPDGRKIASGSCDWSSHRGHDWPRPAERGPERCEWRLWDVASGRAERSVTDEGRLLSLAVSPDGRSLACGIGPEVRLYALGTGAPARVVTRHDADVTSVAFTPDKAAVVSGSHDQTVRCTRLAGGELVWQAPGYFEQVNSVALSADGSRLVTGGGDGRFARLKLPLGAKHMGPGAVRIWEARTGRLLRRLGDPGEQVMAVALWPDGRRVAAGTGTPGGKGAVNVWDAETGAPLWSMRDHAKEVLAVAIAPDGASLATGDAAGTVNVRDAQSGKVTHALADHRGGATAVVFSPDGATLFCGEADGGTRAWDVRTGRPLRTCDAPRPQASSFTIDRLMNCVGLSADGTTLAACASSVNNEYVGAVRIWDARTGQLRRDFSAENIHGRPAALSPDGSIVATGGKSVKLWDAATGKMLRELNGHLKRTQSITFSADGKLLVAGGSYGTTNLWDVASGRHLVTLFTFCDDRTGAPNDDWLAYHPEGFYDGSPGVERYLAWRVGEELLTPATLAKELHSPDRIRGALRQ